MTKSNRKFGIVAAVLIFALLFGIAAGSLSLAHAENETYYICYESDNYRVRASNALTKEGSEDAPFYTVSPTLSRGDRFVISDGAGHLWGGSGGEPVVITESGIIRYGIRFNPDGFESGEYIEIGYYTPETFFITAGETTLQMTYLKARTAYEEYYAYLELGGGETVTVKDGNGVVYGEKGEETDGVSVPLAGKYRFTFTADEDNLYTDGKYITFSEYPTLYLLCEENGYEINDGYVMTRDEGVILYEQYTAFIDVPTKDCEMRFSVLDGDTGEEYKPSENGKITVRDKGRYEVHYSPDHVYSASGDFTSRIELARVEEFYDGWFVLGDFNGFTFIDGDDFETLYKLTENPEETAYDEFKLEIEITDEMIRESDGAVEFYISDGKDIVRRPLGANISIDEAGRYELVFSPTHNYGNGYRYRYTRIGEVGDRETVTVYDARQLADILAACTSPEYSLGKTYLLASDMDLSKTDYTPALIFAGELDGMYRSVKGVHGEDSMNFLFREVTEDGIIHRVSFEVDIDGSERNTALVGTNNGLLEEVTVSGRIKGDAYTAALAAVNGANGKIRACTAEAEITGVLNVGGIVGFNAGDVRSSLFSGKVNTVAASASDSSGMMGVGGIAGYSTGNILACISRGEVGCGQGRYVGGTVGLSSGGLFACTSAGKIAGASYVGGIVGYYGRFEASAENGNVDILDYLTGGRYEDWLDEYFGTGSGGGFEESVDSGIHEIFYCISEAVVTADSYGGGIAGHAGAGALKVLGCVSSAKVNVRYTHAGGIVGEFTDGTVDGCMSLGDITADGAHAGGIAGSASAVVENCQSSAYVAGSSYVGGIVGEGATVRGCVSYAFVETLDSELRLGMIAGSANVGTSEYNFYMNEAQTVGGMDGVTYGSENRYAACGLKKDEIMSEGMLSEKLYGLDPDKWLAGASEPRYPVPRVLKEAEEPSRYGDKAAFETAFKSVENVLEELCDSGSRVIVTVTFYTYDFDSETHERSKSFRLRLGDGIADEDIPALNTDDGYFVRWSEVDFSSFTENTQIFERFDRIITTLASDTEISPLVLVEGKFHSDTVLSLEYNGEYISLKFTRDGKEVSYGDVTVKYLVGDTGRYKINLVHGTEIVDALAAANGKYLCFTLNDGWAFAAVDTSISLFPLWITLAAVGAALVVSLAFAIPIIIIRLKKKKTPEGK